MRNKLLTYRPDRIDLAIQSGVAKAIAEHKAAGRSIAISRNGKVVIVPPEEIEVPEMAQPKIKNTIRKINE